jgi:hypothetical protein
MKKTLFIFSFLTANFVFGQDETPLLHIDSFYENRSEYLIHTVKISLGDSVGKAQLIERVKNWSGTKFVNPKEVLVNETNDQLVYNYIQSLVFNNGVSFKWYVRLLVSVKDDKIRLQFYDDGNVFYTIGTISNPSRSSHLKNYFVKEDGIFPRKMNNSALVNFKNEVKSTSVGLENYIKNAKSQSTPKKDDW